MLGELYGQYHQVSKIERNEKEWLNSIGVSIERSSLHDAAGINDDFPVGRGVFIEDHREFVVLVNFEDHIQVIILPEPKREGLDRCFQRLVKLNQTFDRIGYATDSYLGNLTVDP